MKTKNKIIKISSKNKFEMVDISDQVEDIVKESGIVNGLVNIQSLHTTASIFIQEKETGLRVDIVNFLQKVVDQSCYYQHDDFNIRTENMCDDECANGASHIMNMIISTATTLNIVNNKIQFGTWQKIIFIELDRARERKIAIQVIGE